MTTWNDKDSLIADSESWGLFERSDGFYEIQRCDDHDKQWTDDEAYAFVKAKADAGSDTHKKALLLHGTRWPK